MLTDFADDNQTVMLAPGPGFYSTEGSGNNEARIAYVLAADKLIRAMTALDHGLAEYKKSH